MNTGHNAAGRNAAQIARDAATNASSQLFRDLSAKMCWDAAITCQVMAGVKEPAPITTECHAHVIDLFDSAVTDRVEMQQVPQGASIGFFRGGTTAGFRLMHFMVATGAGFAAGNKNSCIGIGNDAGVGWEILNLAERLDWTNGGFTGPGPAGGNNLFLVRYRPISARTGQCTIV